MTPAAEKTIRFCSKTENSAAIDLLRILLKSDDREIRDKAFEGLYFKKSPEISHELCLLILEDQEKWTRMPFLTPERFSRLIDTIIRGNDLEMAKSACAVVVRYQLYESLPAINSLLERPNPDWIALSTETSLKLATSFYEILASASSSLELRNMDRRREWFASQLEDPVRKFGIHRREEPIKAFLLVTKKDYPLLTSVLDDVHSQACKTIVRLLKESEGGSYYRLLLSYIGDTNAPQIINNILAEKSDKNFVQYLLKWITNAPSQTMRDALKRFNSFSWVRPDNPELADLIEGQEDCFVQLIANTTLPRETTLAMFEFIFKHSSVAGKRTAATLIRSFSGEDVNRILLQAAYDSDPEVCSKIMKIMKTRNIKEADQVIMKNVEHPDPMVRQTIYELMPEFRIENYLQKIGQISENSASLLGRIILNVDPNVRKRLNEDIASAIPFRRRVAIDTIRNMNICEEYEEKLIHILEHDDEVDVRISACMALGNILTGQSVQSLTWASNDRNLTVQRAARQSLEKLQAAYQQQ